MENIVAIIPARANSKSIKNKNIIQINKKPLIAFTIQAALKSKIFKDIIVSTDSKRIKKISEKYGAEVPFLRPKHLSLDKTPTYPVIKDVYLKIKKLKSINYKYICILQPTSPFRNHKHIKEAYSKILETKNADSLISCQRVPHNFIPEKLMSLNNNHFVNYRNLIGLNNINRNSYKIYYARNGSAIYFTSPKILEKSLVGKNTILYEMDKISSIDIDDQQDLEFARLIAKNFKKII